MSTLTLQLLTPIVSPKLQLNLPLIRLSQASSFFCSSSKLHAGSIMIGVDANGTMNELHQLFFIEHGIALNREVAAAAKVLNKITHEEIEAIFASSEVFDGHRS